MNSITSIVGHRVRAYRQQRSMTQEELAERAELHPTYISQVERGEKNVTLVSLEKILLALDMSFSEFFQHLETQHSQPNYAAECYDLISTKSRTQQAQIYQILYGIEQLMK